MKTSFLDKLIGRIDRVDSQSLQGVVLKLAREKGFLETLFNTIQEGVIVTDADGVVAVASERLLPTSYPGAGYVHYVGARRRARGQRLGALVTVQCLSGFARRGLESAVLETDDFRVRALVTYLRLGFVPSYRTVEEQTAWSVLFPTLLEKRS